MRRIILASVAASFALSAAQVASAADMPMVTKAPVVVPVSSWTGYYIGGNVGGSWNAGDINYTTPFTQSSFRDNSGSVIGGGQIGYNWQSGVIVWGVEADIAYRHITNDAAFIFGNTPTAGSPFGSLAGDNAVFSTEQNWLGTVRGRIGYGAGRWLPYVTGGLAYGGVKQTVTETLVAPNQARFRTASNSETRLGWTAGAGFEYAFTGPWSASVEYLYVDLGDSTISQAASTNLVVFPADSTTTENTSHNVRVKLNYRFGQR